MSTSELNIQHDVDLSGYTTFGFSQRAEHYVEIKSDDELVSVISYAGEMDWPVLVLGGGSNVVLTQDYKGLVIRLVAQHIRYDPVEQTNDVHVSASAGVNWHTLVRDSTTRNLAGLENLSLIPGSVGAAPVQNIGAYGVELQDRFVSLKALHLPTCQWQEFNTEDCKFTYRDSLFKQCEGEYIITQVTLALGNSNPLNTSYSALNEYLLKNHSKSVLTPQLISDSVCDIRRDKLPDPDLVPNAGSFFHNPVVTRQQFQLLQEQHADIVGYRQSDDSYKLAAGWLIDKLGYKGYRQNGVGVHDKQALVLVRYGQSTGNDLLELADAIQQHVVREFDVRLCIEPRVL